MPSPTLWTGLKAQVQRTARRIATVPRHFTRSASDTQSHSSPLAAMSLPETVKAIAIDKTGDVDVLEVKNVPFPKPNPGNVVIKVRIHCGRSRLHALILLWNTRLHMRVSTSLTPTTGQ